MKYGQLKYCVESLKAMQAQKHEEFDASTAVELDEVIRLLEGCLSGDERVTIDWTLSIRTLQIFSKCLELTTNISALVRVFLSGE